jgi:hypothetical protein
MSTRQITLAIAILSTLATALLVVRDIVPPAWGLLVSSVGAGLYALVRSAQKLRDGATLKSLLSTTEAWGTGLVVVASIASAAAGVVPAKCAGGTLVIAGLALKAARVLQANGFPGGQPPVAPQG